MAINHGQTKKITVGFPLPRSPYNMDDMYPYASWDEAQIALRTLYGDDNSPHEDLMVHLRNPEIIDFSVLVNAKEIRFKRHMRAIDSNGHDIMETLRKYRIPISSAYLRGFCEQPPMDLLPGLKETLKDLRLLDSKDRPDWYLQTTYTWDQEFQGNKTTAVEHSYTPSVGMYFIDLEDFNDRKNINVRSAHPITPLNLDNCTIDFSQLDTFLKNWKKKNEEKNKDESNSKVLYEIQYVLKTGANWKGPIANFELIITPENADDLVILEGKYPIKRSKNGDYVIQLKNFTPQHNLRICMIPAYKAWQDESSSVSLPQKFWKTIKSFFQPPAKN